LRYDARLEDAVALMAEHIVGSLDVIQLEPVGCERGEIDPSGRHHGHQATHAFLAARGKVS